MKPPLILAALVLALSPAAAWAYIDPGAGMLVWQGLIAVIGGVVAFFRTPRELLRRLWKRLTGK